MKLFIGTAFATAVQGQEWAYTAQADWPSVSPNCASTVANQSPINVDTTDPIAITDPLVFQGLPDSAVNPLIKQRLEINNHTWEVSWDIDDEATTKYGVEYNGKVFKLMQFHFHSPSEHTFDGNHYDFEAHLVHACYGNITCTTPDPNDENLVVSIVMNVGDEHPYLASFWPQLAALAENESAPSIVDDMGNPYNLLVPPQPHDFFRYIGSTTTPTCVQNVEWFLMATPATLSQEQLTSYRTAITAHANSQVLVQSEAPQGVSPGWDVTLGTNNRAIQPMLNRVPEKYTSPAEIAQQQRSFMWHGITIFVVVVGVAMCCLAAFIYSSKPKDKPKAKPKSRAVKPKKEAPKEEVPLLAPAPPLLFTQPLQVPMTVAAPQVQLQQMPVQQMVTAPQIQQSVRPLMVAP